MQGHCPLIPELQNTLPNRQAICAHGGKGCTHASVVHGLAGAGGGGPAHIIFYCVVCTAGGGLEVLIRNLLNILEQRT